MNIRPVPVKVSEYAMSVLDTVLFPSNMTDNLFKITKLISIIYFFCLQVSALADWTFVSLKISHGMSFYNLK